MISVIMGLCFLLFLLTGIPIAFCIGISSLTTLWLLKTVPLKLVAQRMFTGLDSFPLMAIPFFMLAGELMITGGIVRGLYKFADVLVGHIRGGLAHVNVVGSMFFAGISGSAVADVSALGKVEIEMMTEGGYDLDFSAAITAASSLIGPIIPPSIPMVIYAISAGGVSIAGLFLSGAIPGILLGLVLMAICYVIALKRNYPKNEAPVTFWEFLSSLKSAILMILMPAIILGGILSGVFTPTEAAAVAVLYALVVGLFVTKELKLSDLPQVLLRSGEMTGVVMLVVATANIFSWILATQQVPQMIMDLALSITNNPWIFLLLVNIFLLIVGCFMDTTAALLIFVPILAPVASTFRIHPLHFGIVVILNLVIGLGTPPVGLCLYVCCGVARLSLERITKAIWPLLLVEILVLFIVTYIPAIPLFLPKLLGYY